MRRTLRDLWGPGTGWFLAIWLVLLFVGRERMLRDPGTFWHTVVGERMLVAGAPIRTDPFSFTCGGQRWIAQQWLGEIVMAAIHRLAGLDGLLLAAVTLISFVYASLGRRLRRAEAPGLIVATIVTLVIAASSYHFMPRPHLMTIVIMASVYGLLCDVESGRRSDRAMLVLPLLMVIWTNLHGGALGGLATILLVVAGWLLLPARLKSTEVSPRRAILCAGACLSIVAVLMNPYGASLPAVWLRLMTSTVMPTMIIEHAPLNMLSVEGAAILALAAIYLVMLTRAWPGRRHVTWLVPLVWLFLAISRVRHGPLFALTAGIAIAQMWPYARLGAWRPSLARTTLQGPQFTTRLWTFVPACCIAAALLVQVMGWRIPIIGAGWCRPSAEYWPVRTALAVQNFAMKRAGPVRVFNDVLFGGYLIYHVPNARVYIDDRCELYGDAGLLRYAELCRKPALIDGLAAYDDVALALVMAGTPMDRFLADSPRWKRLSTEPAASLYERIEPANER